jgi:hypothetical protein
MDDRKLTTIPARRIMLKGLILFGIALLSGCEIDTRIRVTGQNSPQFTFSGTGLLAQLYVSGPFTLNEAKLLVRGDKLLTKEERLKIDQAIGGNRLLWQLDPGRRRMIADLPAIIYGNVPAGFIQRYPPDNAAPLPLREGYYYTVYAPSYNANDRITRFIFRNGKAVEVSPEEISKAIPE